MRKRQVNRYSLDGEYQMTYDSVRAAGKDINPDAHAAHTRIITAIRTNTIAYGYRWKYSADALVPSVNIFQYTEKETKDGKKIDAKIHANTEDKESILEEFIHELGIDMTKWVIKESRISRWSTSARDREQDLEWEIRETDNGPIQLMEGYSKRGGWTQTYNYSISVSFRPNENEDLERALIEIFSKNPITYSPDIHFITNPSKGTGILCEMAPFDVHFGKAASRAELGYREYNLNIAANNFDTVVKWNLEKAAKEHPEKIVFIVGEDIMHVENMLNETTRGRNHLDVDTRLPNIYRHTFSAVKKACYDCRSVAPLEVKYIPGNHDYASAYALCFALSEHFRNDKYVKVDVNEFENNDQPRKAMLWGNLLVGWTHQIVRRQEAWANELAAHFRELWGQSKFAEWHFGDQHKKKEQRTMPVMTAGGVTLRQLTALSPIDKWHYDNLYTDAVPGGEMFLWSKDSGVFANYTKWIGERDND